MNGLCLKKVNCMCLSFPDGQHDKEEESNFKKDSELPLQSKGLIQEEQLLAMNFS